MTRKLIFFLLILCLIGNASAFAKKKVDTRAPRLPKKGAWIPERPQNLKRFFKDKITLIYFWDYTSVNSLREVSTIRKWHRLYHPYGFEVIWIHAPEFSFAGKQENVEKAVKRLEIEQPVYLDNDFKVWEAYKIKSWPTKIVVDQKGEIALRHVGEGEDAEFEYSLRDLILELSPSTVLPRAVKNIDREKFDVSSCGLMSGETYLGHKRATWWGAKIANREWIAPDETIHFKDRGKRVDRGFFAQGIWSNYEDAFLHARSTDAPDDYLGLIYFGYEVYALLNKERTKQKNIRVYVTRDERPVPIDMRGLDLKEDTEGDTYFNLEESRLYYLISNEDSEPHELRLWVQDKGVAINSFSFSNRCLSEFEHL